MSRSPVLVLLGPTAVGKTAVVAPLCRRLEGEVIAADSRQIYRGAEIGSASPTAAERAAAPHHLVGFLDPRQVWSVAEFVAAAEAAIADVLARGRTPIVVAGTGMYIKALVAGWTLTAVPAAPEVREALEAELAQVGSVALHARLAAVDPEAALRLPPADTRRIVRALEVHAVTARPLSEHLRESGLREVPYDYRLAGLRRDRVALYERIDARVDAMVAAGWPDEVRALLASGITDDDPVMEALGYRRLAAAVRGELPGEEALALTRQDTRRFAKRQMTWFRAMPGVAWFDVDHAAPEDTADAIAAWWQESGGGEGATRPAFPAG